MRTQPLRVDLQEFSHIPRKVGPLVQTRINALGIGQKMQDLPEHLWHDSFRYYVKEDPTRNGGPNLRMIRLDPKKPSLTVTGYIFNKFVHPYEDRFITPREAARLQGFPDDYLFSGNLTSVQRQVGNAVPVQLMRAVAAQVLEHIVKHRPRGLGKDLYAGKGFPVISLFTGAGGMDLGVLHPTRKGSYFDVQACVEFDHDCCETLRKNFRDSVEIFERSISDVDPHKVLSKCGIEGGILPLLVGGPPCQAFSQAGKQKGTEDPRGNLVFEYLRFVRLLKPLYFIMENVANLRGVDGGRLLRAIESEIRDMGYGFTRSLLSAADYGAPQLRRRLIFIGVKQPFPVVSPPAPTHGRSDGTLFPDTPYVPVEEAFRGLPSLENQTSSSTITVPEQFMKTVRCRGKRIAV